MMADIFNDTDNIVGGRDGALQTDFPTSVSTVFADPPKGAMIAEGDFVAGRRRRPVGREAGRRLRLLRLPVHRRLADGRRRRRQRSDHVQGLAGRRRRSRRIWPRRRPARSGPSAAASRRRTRTFPESRTPTRSRSATATPVGERRELRFDMSDLAPAAVRLTRTSSTILQDFFKNPRRRRHGEEARGGGGEGVQVGTREVDDSRRKSWGRRLRGPPRRAGSGRGGRGASPAFIGPAFFLIAVFYVYPTIRTIIRSFFEHRGRVRRDRQLQADLHRRHPADRDEEQRDLGRGRAGRRHGVRLIFAVLTERSRGRSPSSSRSSRRWRSRSSRRGSSGADDVRQGPERGDDQRTSSGLQGRRSPPGC